MIRTRLAVAFALLSLLALVQYAFAAWAAASAAHHAERSVVATRMLAGYLGIGGNKQRLKVWFAQRMLADDADPVVRDRLLGEMWRDVDQLRALAVQLPPDAARMERAEVEAVALNIAALEQAVLEVPRPGAGLSPDAQWRKVLRAFDELSGRDMREAVRLAVERQQAASLRESELLAVALGRIRVVNALLAGAVVLLGVFAVVYFIRRLDRPFGRLSRTAEALAAGDFGARSGVSGHDEFARLGALIDAMAARVAEAQARGAALQQQLDDLVAERTRALTQAYESLLGIEARRRQFFAELGHELRTPATVIRGEAELALRNPGDAGEQRAALQRIVDAAGELGGRVQDLLDAARGGSVEYAFTLRHHLLADTVAAAVAQMQAVAAHRGIRLRFDPGEAAPAEVAIDRERFQQALVVVLDNAIRYSPPRGMVRVTLVPEAEHWQVCVDDEGPGMPAEELALAFEPHRRGRAGLAMSPQGLGIGLAIARRILEAMRGGIDLQARPGGGLRAIIALPLAGLMPERAP